MSDVVLDASFMVKLLVEEPGSKLSKATFEAYEHGNRFLVPGHAYAEVLEVIRRKAQQGDGYNRSAAARGADPADGGYGSSAARVASGRLLGRPRTRHHRLRCALRCARGS